jgi:hypothetical protein
MPTTTETDPQNAARELAREMVVDLAETLRIVCDDPRGVREDLNQHGANVYHAADALASGPLRDSVRNLGNAAWAVKDALDHLREDADQLAADLALAFGPTTR